MADSKNMRYAEPYTPKWLIQGNGTTLGDDAAIQPKSDERDTLDRVQRFLLWFASMLIAITIYTQIRANLF